jgi:hypothetical protein
MKKSFVLLSVVFLSLLFMASLCEKPDNRPECEKHNTGSYTVYNGKSISIFVKIYTDKGGFTSGQFIFPGNSYQFMNVPAGDIQLWEEDADSPMGYWDDYVTQCFDKQVQVAYNKSDKIYK